MILLLILYTITAAVLLIAWARCLSRAQHPEPQAQIQPAERKPTGQAVPLRGIK